MMSDFKFDGETEQSIVLALRQGRQEMLGKLYDAYAPVLMGVINRVVQDQEVAEEVLKETFVAIWSRIGVYDASKERLLSWGLAIARGIALEALKSDRYAPAKETGNKSSYTSYLQNDNVILQRGELELTHLCNLDPLEKTALDLLYLKGRSCTETAAELHMTVEQLKALLKKAFIHLKTAKTV